MKMSLSILSASVALSFSGAVLADPSLQMPDSDWDFVAAKLLNEGYSVIHLVHDGSNRITATDPSGSEVLMLVDPATHQVVSMTYVNPLDE